MIESNLFTKRTARIVELLNDFEHLGENLPGGKVHIIAGVEQPQLFQYAVFVYRARVTGYGYWMGQQGTDFAAMWALACITKHLANPAALEHDVSTLAANVIRCLSEARQDPLWDSLVPQPSDAVTMRDEANQCWEIEVIPVTIKWQEPDA